MSLLTLLIGGIGVGFVAMGVAVFITMLIVETREPGAPMPSLLTGEPLDTGAPAPVYPLELARRRREQRHRIGGAA